MSAKRDDQGRAARENVPVVILPGLLCDSRMFAGQADAIGARVVDGFYGRADSIGAMATYALDRLPERCALVGHSMGARVALEIWRRAPQRVTRLALADTGVHPVGDGERSRRHALRDLARQAGVDALVEAWLPPMLGISNRGDAGLRGALGAMVTDAGVDAYERQIRALLDRPDARAVLPTITCPTFAIVGEEDEWSPPAQHEEIVAAVDGAQLRVVPLAGHMAPAEAPAAFNSILREWLAWPVAHEDYRVVEEKQT